MMFCCTMEKCGEKVEVNKSKINVLVGEEGRMKDNWNMSRSLSTLGLC